MSGITSVSTAQQSLSFRDVIMRQRKDMNKAGMELATGRKFDIFQGRGNAPAQALEFRQRLESNQAFLTSNAVLATKLSIMDETMTGLRNDIGTFSNFLNLASAASGGPETLQEQARVAIESLAAKLNTTYGGSFLFSGSATSTAPISIDPAMAATYNGDPTGNLEASIDDGVKLAYGVRANEPAFMDVFSILESVVNADYAAMSPTDFNTFRTTTIEALGTASEGLVTIQAQMGNREAILGRRIETQESMKKIMTDGVIEIEGVPAEEAALRVEALRVQLQGSFEVTARITQLSILNYL